MTERLVMEHPSLRDSVGSGYVRHLKVFMSVRLYITLVVKVHVNCTPLLLLVYVYIGLVEDQAAE